MPCDTMLIYRVEHPETKKGPWRHYRPGWYGLERHRGHHPGDLPGPSSDGIGDVPSCHLFGTRTLAQLRKWFHARHLRDMDRAGFVLNVYRAYRSQVKVGQHQVAVSYWDMRLVETRPLTKVIRA